MMTSPRLDPTLIDAASLFDASEVIAERFDRKKITLDYTQLREVLDELRLKEGWRPGSPNTVLLSIDPASEGQRRFQSMLRHSQLEVNTVHFRDTFVSMPPGRSQSDSSGKSITSLSSRIAYIAGLMARHEAPHFLVVSHCFELYGPLTDLSQRLPKGKIGIAYFSSLLDHRWRLAGVFDRETGTEQAKLKVFDLDPFSERLMGIPLSGSGTSEADINAGLSRF